MDKHLQSISSHQSVDIASIDYVWGMSTRKITHNVVINLVTYLIVSSSSIDVYLNFVRAATKHISSGNVLVIK